MSFVQILRINDKTWTLTFFIKVLSIKELYKEFVFLKYGQSVLIIHIYVNEHIKIAEIQIYSIKYEILIWLK